MKKEEIRSFAYEKVPVEVVVHAKCLIESILFVSANYDERGCTVRIFCRIEGEKEKDTLGSLCYVLDRLGFVQYQ